MMEDEDAVAVDHEMIGAEEETEVHMNNEDNIEESEDDEEEQEYSQLEVLAEKLEAMREAGTLPPHLIDSDIPRHPKQLSRFDEIGVAEYILQNDQVEDIVVLGGAGMSTSAGIPDFRSPGTGLYDNLQKYDLPRPQAIFELEYFKERPQAFYELARELWPGGYAPTPTHCFIKLLHEKGRLLRCFTQNIDSLETAAGLPPEKCVAAHGNFDSATCIATGEAVPIHEVKEAVLGAPDGWMALRDRYGGLVKPDIVFFGEGLPKRFFDLANADLGRARLLLVVGTSLSVQPFASLINHVESTCVRVLINRDPVGLRDPRIPLFIANQLGLGGFEFHNDNRNYRDVALLGNCDLQISRLADALGWRQDLDRLVQEARHRFTLASRSLQQQPSPTIPPTQPNQQSDHHDDEDDSCENEYSRSTLPHPPSPAMPTLPPLAPHSVGVLASTPSSLPPHEGHNIHHSSSMHSVITQPALDRPQSVATIDNDDDLDSRYSESQPSVRHNYTENLHSMRHSHSQGAFLSNHSEEPRLNRSLSQHARVNCLASNDLPSNNNTLPPPAPSMRPTTSSPGIPQSRTIH